MEIVRIKTRLLEQNTGQLPGLPANPRTWTQSDIDRIARSLKETPELFEMRPCIVKEHGGRYVILGGNLRFAGAKKNGAEEVPCIVVPEDLPEAKLKEIVIKDNGSFGAWDFEALANEWDDLSLTEWGVPAWDAAQEGAKKEAKEDNFDPEDEEIHVLCAKGDIWQLGDHRLMCGDSTDSDDIQRLMDGNRADICFTSPPYNAHHLDVALSPERGGGTQKATQKKYIADDDHKTDEEYLHFLETNVALMIANCNEVFYNIGVAAGSKRAIVRLLNAHIDSFKDLLYWEKSNPMPVIAKGVISSSVELILAFGKNNSRGFAHFDDVLFHGVISGLSASATNEYADIHKATFPVYLPSTIIQQFCPEKGIVVDCFCGTGTTIVAAEQLNRRCYGMELEPKYCDVIIARWEKLTGKKAVRIEPAA